MKAKIVLGIISANLLWWLSWPIAYAKAPTDNEIIALLKKAGVFEKECKTMLELDAKSVWDQDFEVVNLPKSSSGLISVVAVLDRFAKACPADNSDPDDPDSCVNNRVQYPCLVLASMEQTKNKWSIKDHFVTFPKGNTDIAKSSLKGWENYDSQYSDSKAKECLAPIIKEGDFNKNGNPELLLRIFNGGIMQGGTGTMSSGSYTYLFEFVGGKILETFDPFFNTYSITSSTEKESLKSLKDLDRCNTLSVKEGKITYNNKNYSWSSKNSKWLP